MVPSVLPVGTQKFTVATVGGVVHDVVRAVLDRVGEIGLPRR